MNLRAVAMGSITALLFFAAGAYGADLSLKECVSRALEHNGNLKALGQQSTAAAEDVGIARSRLLPSLRLSGTYTVLDRSNRIIIEQNSFGSGLPATNTDISLNNRTFYGMSTIVEQPLFTGGQRLSALARSKILSEQALRSEERYKTLLIAEVKRSYHEAVREKLYRKSIETILQLRKERLRVLQERFSEGYAQQGDILTMETDVAAAELDLFKAKSREELALSRVKRLISSPQNESIVLVDKPRYTSLIATLQEVKDAALSRREDIKASLLNIKAAEKEIEIAKSDFYPKIFLDGSYTAQRETNITRPEVWAVGARMDWTLFEWGRTSGEVKKAIALKQAVQYDHEEQVKKIALEAEEAWRAVKEGEREVAFHEKKLNTAEFQLHRALDRYAEKAIRPVDLKAAESELVTSYHDYMMAIERLNAALAHLEAAASGIPEHWYSIRSIYTPDFMSMLFTTLQER